MTPAMHGWLIGNGGRLNLGGKLGGACGAPYIHLGPIGVNNNIEKHNGMDHYKDYFVIYGKRFADKAVELF